MTYKSTTCKPKINVDSTLPKSLNLQPTFLAPPPPNAVHDIKEDSLGGWLAILKVFLPPLFLQHILPSHHLHPSRIDMRKFLRSFMYRTPVKISMLLSVMISSHLVSHGFMITRATAQVALNPIGPPACWRKVLALKEYWWVFIIDNAPICTPACWR